MMATREVAVVVTMFFRNGLNLIFDINNINLNYKVKLHLHFYDSNKSCFF